MVSMLNENEIKHLRATFKKIDTDNKGIITVEELKEAMQKLGYYVTS